MCTVHSIDGPHPMTKALTAIFSRFTVGVMFRFAFLANFFT